MCINAGVMACDLSSCCHSFTMVFFDNAHCVIHKCCIFLLVNEAIGNAVVVDL